ncbi:MAG: metallophosphoesterase, partial [Vicinamibacterales bacterium]
MSFLTSRLAYIILVSLLALLPLQAAQNPARLVAVGDIHGSYDALTTILRRAGLVDERLKWSGGRTVLVQTGDYTDRGTDVRKVMDLLMQLEKDAKAAGGQVIALAGNHEIMNAMGDLRDVTPEICATFATPKSESIREEAWTQYERLARARAGVITPPPGVYTQTREAFMQAHAP